MEVEMNVVGIDCGAKNVKALILKEDKILAKSSVLSLSLIHI